MKQKILWVALLCIITIGVFFLIYTKQNKLLVEPNDVDPQSQVRIANPASVNCITQGGRLDIKKRGDGSEYGVCAFEDNRWCEEWALLRGDCSLGGRKIIGYDTEDQIYCAILGGTTLAEPNSKCTFSNGKVCSTIDLFNGTCSE